MVVGGFGVSEAECSGQGIEFDGRLVIWGSTDRVPGKCERDRDVFRAGLWGYGPDYGAVWISDSMGCGDQVPSQLKRKIPARNEKLPRYYQKMCVILTLCTKSVNFSPKVPTDR